MDRENTPSSYYVWLDTEFTSLELEQARLLQIAVMITGRDLKRVTAPEDDLNLSIALAPNQAISPWVEENIPDVVAACREPGALPISDLDNLLTAFLDANVGAAAEDIYERPVLAGNSLQADWFLMRRFAPTFLQRCHYRMLDVTALKLQWMDLYDGPAFDKESPDVIRQWFPDAHLPAHGPHDAYYDIQASAAELAFYRAGLARSGAATR